VVCVGAAWITDGADGDKVHKLDARRLHSAKEPPPMVVVRLQLVRKLAARPASVELDGSAVDDGPAVERPEEEQPIRIDKHE